MLALVGSVHLVTAAAFVAVGLRLRSRAVQAPLGLARDAFVVWWLAFAAFLAGQGVVDLLAAAGSLPLWVAATFRIGSGPLLAVAAWGLAYHILFLWTGRRGLALPLGLYYAVAGVAYSAWLWAHRPVAVAVGDWSADVAYAEPVTGPLWNAVLASIGLPLVLGAMGYLALAPLVHRRDQRYRIVLVGASLLVWVVAGYSAQVAAGEVARFVAIVVLGLFTAGSVLAAYFPPAPVRRWLAAAGTEADAAARTRA